MRTRLAIFALSVATALCFALGAYRAVRGVRSVDFVAIYAGGRAMLHGDSPYRINDLQKAYEGGGGRPQDRNPWEIELPIYPPSIFPLVLPFAALPYYPARALWTLVNGGIFLAGVWSVLWMVPPRSRTAASWLLAVAVLSCTTTIALGNATALALGCGLIALALLLREERRAQHAVLAAVLLGASLAAKPPLFGLLLLFLFFRKRMRLPLLGAAVVAGLLLLAGAAWLHAQAASADWPAQLHNAVAFSLSSAGNSSPLPWNVEAARMMQLQTVFAVLTPNASVYNALSWMTALALAMPLLWFPVPGWKEKRAQMLGIAIVACVTLLPVYHRLHDGKLLLIAVPALLLLMEEGAYILAAITLALTANALFSPALHLVGHAVGDAGMTQLSPLNMLLLARQPALSVAALAVCFLIALYRSADAASAPLN